MAFDAQALADLFEAKIKTAIAPLAQRVRALEARTVSLDSRQQACVEKALAEWRVCADENLMYLAAGLSADGADEATITEGLAWARTHNRQVEDAYQRDLIGKLSAAARTASRRVVTPAE